MPGPFTPADTLIGPIITALTNDIVAQIPAVGAVYPRLPDRPPTDNSVIIPLLRAKIIDETNGKVTVRLFFAMRHLFRRAEIADTILRAYTFIMPWLNLLTAWANQNLNGLARQIDVSDLTVIQVSQSAQPMIALAINIEVLTEFNIILT